MKRRILQLLYFSRGDARAAVFLVSICFSTTMAPSILKKQFNHTERPEPEWEKQLTAAMDRLEKAEEMPDTLQPLYFNPNTVSLDSLLDMNVPDRVARTLIKYREKGGQFWKKEDLQRVYGVDSALYAGLEPYIQIPARSFKPKAFHAPFSGKSYEKKAPHKIEINSAGVEEWQGLHGIGPVLSKRIVKFRDALGGFRSIDQVGETYGLADSVFQQLRSQLVLSEAPNKIDINRCTVEILAAHPYISWSVARRIIRYREQHGPFEDLEALKGLKELPEDFFEQVGAYLHVGE